MYRTLILFITILNIINLLVYSYVFSSGNYLTLYIKYVIIAHSICYFILFKNRSLKNWWIIVLVNVLITTCSIFLHILYIRVSQAGH